MPPVPPTTNRLRIIREGRAVVRAWHVPKPIVLVDTRERMPLPLFDNHPNWIAAERRATLKTGDYTIEDMETLLTLERKTLADAVNSAITNRGRFISACERLAAFRWKAILIEATYEDLKSPFKGLEDIETDAHPNAVCGTFDAIEAKFDIPIIYTSRDRSLATECAASWLSKHFTYWWLEQNGHGRILVDTDRL